MKTMYLFLCLFLVGAIAFSCECKDDEDSGFCYEFDRRQCSGDEWAEMIPASDSKAQQESKMKDYLESKEISVSEVRLVIDFHEFVCEACYSCPQGDRFFVEINSESDSTKLQALELLGLSECQ